jgi:hypothetical protein
MSKGEKVDQFLKEKPVHSRPRRLVDWINPTGARKVHSLIENPIDSFPHISNQEDFVKAVCGKTARTV